MSYQAITDFLINPVQLQQDYKNFSPNKDTFSIQPSTSFEDLVSFYKEMNETPESEGEKIENNRPLQEKKTEKQEESLNSDKETVEKAASDSESKVLNKENQLEDSKEKPLNKKPVVKKEASEKELNQNSDLSKADTVKSFSKSEVRGKEKIPAEKKKELTKEFDRMQQLLQEEEDNSSVQTVLQVASLNNQEIKFEDNDKSDEKSETLSKLIHLDEKKDSQELEAFVKDSKNAFYDNEKADKSKLFLDKEKKITVQDLRTENKSSENLNQLQQNEAQAVKKSSLKASEIKFTAADTAEITFDLAANAQNDLLSLNSQSASANGSNFQAMLLNQLQSSTPDFVKAGSLILKDNNQGTINLVIHPDDLGNVKVHLSLDGKSLSAHITVSSKEALQVFKENSETLREAFSKNGFDVSEFDVAYNDGGSFNQNMDFENQQEQSNFVANKVYNSLRSGDDSLTDDLNYNIEKKSENSNYSINIVA